MPNHDRAGSIESTSAQHIPTLTERYQDLPDAGDHIEHLIARLSQDLQASLHQHLYQAMTATLHQLINKESEHLRQKIHTQLRHHIPVIIKQANGK